jgi:hypothetical protein
MCSRHSVKPKEALFVKTDTGTPLHLIRDAIQPE